MAERGKGKKCADCAYWHIKDSPCTYQEEIRQGTIRYLDPVCEDFYPKGKERPKLHKTSGYSNQGYFEAIYHKGKPAFLTIDNGNFQVHQEVTAETDTFVPKEAPDEYPYEKYGYYENALPSMEELFWKVRDEFNLFLDVEPIWKDYLAACVLLSYQQEKARTIPYIYFVGDNESGKTVALNLLNWLCYRPLLGVTIPSADVYGYLDSSDAPGTILEDEAQGLQRDMDKAKIYKAGYKKGAVVPRTIMLQNKRFIKFFRVFCLKACAAEENPRVKGLLERFTFISMVEGYPNKDWADFNDEDEKRLRNLRNMLLKWRLTTIQTQLPEVDLPVKGRLKELWKPIIQTVTGLNAEADLRRHLEKMQAERLNEKTNTLEGHLVKVVCELYIQGETLPFSNIWDTLANDLGGKIDDKKPNKMDTAEFGEITKQKIGYRIREVLCGKKVKVRGQDGPARNYQFDLEKLKRIAKKYGCTLVPKFPTTPSSCQASTNQNQDTHNEPTEKPVEPKPQESDESKEAPLKRVQLGNTGTITFEELSSNTKNVCRLDTDFGIETCVLCGTKERPDWQVDLYNGEWGFLCGPCGLRLTEKLNNQN